MQSGAESTFEITRALGELGFGADAFIDMQINEMREDVSLCCGEQRGRCVVIDRARQIRNFLSIGVQSFKDFGFARAPMCDDPADA